MKIAAVQMVSTPDVARNLDAAARWVAQAAQQGAHLVVLPEYFCLMGHRDTDKLAHAEPFGHGPIQQALADTARRHGVWLVGGTLPLRADGATASPDAGPGAGPEAGPDAGPGAAPARRVRNACCVFAPDGGCVARYDKIHLFAFDNGREHYDEGQTLDAGSAPVSFAATLAGGTHRVGLSVCYDVRFPELYRRLAEPVAGQPCDVMCVPAAFTHTTGEQHWALLLRARAVENQCFVVAAAQGGRHENGRRTWGHSMVIGPWGEVLAEVTADGEGLALADCPPQRLADVRLQLPALRHRRL